ncbi:DNA topoisomerase IV subunit A [Candidatus Micrarchaeota archaeon]|nr:DNA topoisomerase IV subunit A [Candidatus Micrarchaeota archaeon]
MAAKKTETESKKKTIKHAPGADLESRLADLGQDVWHTIEGGDSPLIEIPVRGLSNVSWDKKTNTLKLGEKLLKRNFLNTAHSRKFMQTMLVAAYCYKHLLKPNLHGSQRDLYYALKRTLANSDENTFDDQRESDPCIVDLEVTLETLRERLHVSAAPKGRVVGPATIEDRGDTIRWDKMGSGGWAIPSNVEDIRFKDVSADYLLAVEKDAAFERLNEDKFWEKQNCILLTAGGQFSRGARRIIQRISREHKLPVYVLTDADGYGWYIYSVIKFGSMALAHASTQIATPEAQFIGVTLTDVEKHGLQKYTIKAEAEDLKRTKEIMQYPWFQRAEWQKELKKALETQRKAEIEALSSKGLQYITKTYLPQKIADKDFLP